MSLKSSKNLEVKDTIPVFVEVSPVVQFSVVCGIH